MKEIIKDNKKYFIFLFGISIVDTLLSLLVPTYINYYSDSSFDKKDLVTIIVISIIGILIQLSLVYIKEKFAYKHNIKEMNRLMTKVYNAKYDYVDSKGVQYLVDLVAQSVVNITMYINMNIISLFISILSIVISIVIISTISLSISGILLVLIPINFLGYKYLNNNLKDKSKKSQIGTSKGLQQIVTLSSPIENLKQYSNDNVYVKTISKPIKTIYGNLYEVNKYGQIGSYFLSNINNLGRNLIYVVLLFNTVFLSASPFKVISISIILPLYFSSLNTIVKLNLNSSSYQGALDFIAELDQNKENTDGEMLDKVNEIELDLTNLVLDEKHIKVDIHEKLYIGDFVDVSGISGSGKSTLLKAIVSFREQPGILINRKESYLYSKTNLREKVLYVSQEGWVMEGTVLENILIGNEDIDTSVLKLIEPILSNSNINMKTKIDEGGNNISTGEKQRISLMRALCKDFDVLLIDEAISNLDIESSQAIYSLLKETFKDKIIMIVSHDKSHEKFCNKSIRI